MGCDDDDALVRHLEIHLEGPPRFLQNPTRKVHSVARVLLFVGRHEFVHALGDVSDLGAEVFAQLLLALLEECSAGLVILLAVSKVLDLLAELVAHAVDGLLLQQRGVDDDAVPLLALVLAKSGFCKDALACDIATGILDCFLDLSFTCHNDKCYTINASL